jgi:hypothetical protein
MGRFQRNFATDENYWSNSGCDPFNQCRSFDQGFRIAGILFWRKSYNTDCRFLQGDHNAFTFVDIWMVYQLIREASAFFMLVTMMPGSFFCLPIVPDPGACIGLLYSTHPRLAFGGSRLIYSAVLAIATTAGR